MFEHWFRRDATEDEGARFLEVRDIPATARPQVDTTVPLTAEGNAVWEHETAWLKHRFPKPPGWGYRSSFQTAVAARQRRAHQADLDAHLYRAPSAFQDLLGTRNPDILAAICGPAPDMANRGRIQSDLVEENRKRLAGQPNHHEAYVTAAEKMWAGYASKMRVKAQP